jgi:anti-sigma-K factor RskA
VPEPHEQFAELTGLYVLGALTGAERQAFEAHAAGCAECAAEIQALNSVSSALGGLAPPADPSPAVRARLMASLSGEPRQTLRRARAPIAAWLVAAASLALAVALGGYAVELRRGAREGRLVAAVLAAPDLARIDLAGQPTAPSASARAFWSRSQGLVFTASNLPPAPAGRVYQLWVLSSQPAPTSAGLLRPDAAGRVTAAFKTPPDLPQPVAMAVTLEPDGGVPAPTGDKYVVGVVTTP